MAPHRGIWINEARKLAIDIDTKKSTNARPKMLESGSLFGFAFGLGCGMCIGWLMRGKFRSKATSLATGKTAVSAMCER